MSRNVLVVADVRNGKLRNVSFEAVSAGVQMAEGGEVTGLVVGKGVRDLAQTLAHYGATKALAADDALLETYIPDAYLAAVEKAVSEVNPDVILFAHSAIGRDLAPRLAAKLGAGQASDVTAFAVEDGQVVFTRPIYAGKAFTKVRFEKGPIIATIRPNNLQASEPDTAKTLAVSDLTTDLRQDLLRSFIREIVKKSSQGVDLAEAKIIVSGGRGVKSAEGFNPLRELADVLGAAVGASRGACDAEYCDYSMQIGQTGKVVTPDLYIACGISGAIQHLAGMSGSKVIVAVNKDPEAPIFKVANYGIVGDLFEVVPMLTEEFKRVLGS